MSLALLEELLRRGQRATVRARGGSMWPAVRDGDVLTLAGIPQALDLQALKHRELVAVCCGDALVIHRAVRLQGRSFLLRGDACRAPDGLFPLSAALGRVVAVRRAGRPVRPGRGRLAPLFRLFLRAGRALRRARPLAPLGARSW